MLTLSNLTYDFGIYSLTQEVKEIFSYLRRIVSFNAKTIFRVNTVLYPIIA